MGVFVALKEPKKWKVSSKPQWLDLSVRKREGIKSATVKGKVSSQATVA